MVGDLPGPGLDFGNWEFILWVMGPSWRILKREVISKCQKDGSGCGVENRLRWRQGNL